jgi:hypothetical protein
MKRFLPVMLILVFLLPACAGRTPSNAKTAHLSKKYFNKYGKKYKETDFFNNKVKSVEIKRTEELQKNVATSFVLLDLADGKDVPVILTMIRKFPMGWRITGWERVPD